jgi:DNA-binding response OmpR family regulator
MRMLLVEDDTALGAVLKSGLSQEQYVVDWVQFGLPAAMLARQRDYACILLDLTLPDCDGLQLCRQLRSAAVDTPILVISGRATLEDRVRGLDIGADDYLVKPFEIREMLARVRALLRRPGPGRPVATLTYGPVHLNLSTHEATLGGEPMRLTVMEFRLLHFFMQHAERVVSHEQLIREVWGGTLQRRSNSPEVYISYLREKLSRAAGTRIHTVRGVGYRLMVDGGVPTSPTAPTAT